MNHRPKSNGRSRLKIIFLPILWALFPPALFLVLTYSIIKPAIKGVVPNHADYILWIVGLIAWSLVLNLPSGSISSIADALKHQKLCELALLLDLLLTTGSIILIFLALRKQSWPNPFIPLKKFKLDKTISLLLLLCFMPFFLYLFPEAIPSDPSDEKHPLIIAFSVSLRNSSYFYIIIGFLSIGLLGPILEEFIFRGLLLEETHDQNRKKWVRYLLDAFVCLFFAVLHIPVSFFIPLVAAIAFIYVRRRSKSLLPSIFMHIAWNTNLLIILLISGGY